MLAGSLIYLNGSMYVTGRSSVLREKLIDSTEKKEDKVVLKLEEEDVDLEVIHQFLTFIYSGRLKDTRNETTAEPLWVESLPELVQLALKVGTHCLILILSSYS